MTINPFILHGEEITPVRKLLYLKALAGGAPLSEYTETGNPVSFNTNVAKPLSVLAAFSPVQAGSGDPSPDNVRPITGWTGANVWRTGKNQIDKETVGYTVSKYVKWEDGTLGSWGESWKASGYLRIKGNAKYVLTCKCNGIAAAGVAFYDTSKTYISGVETNNVNGVFTFTTPANAEYLRFTAVEPNTYPVMLEFGETPSPYEEYTGQSVSVTFPALGANLLDKSKLVDGKIWWKGVETSGYSPNCCTPKIPVVPGTSYSRMGSAGGQSYASWFDSDGNYLSQSTFSLNSPSVAPEGAYFVGISLSIDAKDEAMLYVTGSATAYEPFTNTAYGGTLDLATGVLTVDMMSLNLGDTDKLNWQYGSGNGSIWITNRWGYPDLKPFANGETATAYCDKLLVANYSSFSNNNERDLRICVDTLGKPRIRYNAYDSTQVAGLYEFLSGMTFIAELAVPLVYQLTHSEIQTLIGTNVLWSDTNGDMEIKYLKKG